MATKRVSLLAALALLMGIAALVTTADAWTCNTTYSGNIAQTRCY